MAAILVVVAYHMSEWRTIRAEVQGAPRPDVAVLVTTFLLTVVVDLTVAISVGMVLAAFLFMKRMADTTTFAAVAAELRAENEERSEGGSRPERHARVPRDVEVYDVNGPFFFGAAEAFKDALRQVHWKPRALIIDMEDVPVIDSTGIRALGGLQPGPRATLLGSPLAALFGPGQLDYRFDDAVEAVGLTGEHAITPG